MKGTTRKIFLSAVSDELGNDRLALKSSLVGPFLEVKEESDFINLGGYTLAMLDTYISSCHGVVHLLGDATGSYPDPYSVAALLRLHPDLLAKLSFLPDLESNGHSYSYTQWEAYLAIYYEIDLYIFRPSNGVSRGPRHKPCPTEQSDQFKHRLVLERIGRFSREFEHTDRLRELVLQELLHASYAQFLTPALLKLAQSSVGQAENATAVRLAFRAASLLLLSWSKALDRGEWLARSELQTLQTFLNTAMHSTTLLLGGPGSGKSALLAKFGVEAEAAGFSVLGIKADRIPDGADTPTTFASYLGLPAGVVQSIRTLATTERVLVLIDQLDALAGLVDLRTGRLNILLNLVRDLDRIPNVHVVCSCRDFERRRDSRLAAIEAEVIELSLPEWTQVSEVIEARGISTLGWPPDFQELLRPPQHLKVFLQAHRPGQTRSYVSYQALLDDLWATRVTDSGGKPGRSELLADIAKEMANRENPWIPAVLFEERQDLIADMVGGEILTTDPTGAGLGFTHQTLFEHAWARAFARGQHKLSEYVIDRQHGLFVRPTLWASLNYLRGADRVAYRKEFGIIWALELRRHLRHLLIELLGQIQDPDIAEEHWIFAAAVDPTLASRVLASVRGNPAWFKLLARAHLPRLMRDSPDTLGQLLVAVIASSWNTARNTCLALLRDNWAHYAVRDELTFRTLLALPAWDQESFNLLLPIVERTELNRSAVMQMAVQIAESQAGFAVRILARALRSDIDRLERLQITTPGELDESNEIDRSRANSVRLQESMRQIIANGSGWWGLEELAEREPGIYVTEMWPLLVRILSHIAGPEDNYRREFRTEQTLDFEHLGVSATSDGGSSPHPFPDSFDIAVATLARRDPSAFIDFLGRESGRDSEIVQRLLARGLAAGGLLMASESVSFLTEDLRRFRLGTFADGFADTIRLLRTVAPHLTPTDLARLETAIEACNRRPIPQGMDTDLIGRVEGYNRSDRLRLLTQLPRDRLSSTTRATLERDIVAFPDYEEMGVHRIEGGFIGSPLSAAGMAACDDEALAELFHVLKDETGHTHPQDFLQGGSIQAAQEFRIFAKEHPQRVAGLLARFEPGKQERPAGEGLVGFADSDASDEDMFTLVTLLDQRGFRSQEFRTNAADALAKRLRQRSGLPEAMTHLLEEWLKSPWEEDPLIRPLDPVTSPPTPKSILWNNSGVGISPGVFNVLHTLTCGYMMREPPAAHPWLVAISAYLERTETAGPWQTLYRELQQLRRCNPEEATCFLRKLFTRHPDFLTSWSGCVLLTHVWWFCPEHDVWIWLGRLRASDWQLARQAYGELIALRATHFPHDLQAQSEVAALLNPRLPGESELLEERIGLALAGANLYQNSKTNRFATDILVGLIPGAKERLARAILLVFRGTEEFTPDDQTHRLLETVAGYLPILAWLDEGWLLEKLEALLPYEAEAACRIGRELVRLQGSSEGALRQGWVRHASHLTAIAITVHRMESPLREMGLELFEAMLELHLPDAEAALMELDQRLPAPLVGVMPRRRRTKRAKASH